MIFSDQKFYNQPKILTKEEQAEKQRQEGLLGVKLANRRFYCSEKLTGACKQFFYDVPQAGRCGDDDGRHFVEVTSLNLEIKAKLAARSSNNGFHEFLNKCYNQVIEIHEKRLQAVNERIKLDQDFGKFREETLKTIEKNLSEMRQDKEFAQNGKTKKPQPAFDKDNFKSWPGLNEEDAQGSKDRLTEQKTGLLKKADDLEKQILQFTTEAELFEKKVDALKLQLEAASDESEYKNIRLSFDYNQLQVEKFRKKIEKLENEKTEIQTQIEDLDRQIEVLSCVLDRHSLIHEIKNFEDRKNRIVTRVEKTLRERNELYTMRTNLNARWNELTREPPKEKIPSAVSPYRQDTPIKLEELCEPLTLKASAKIYFI